MGSNEKVTYRLYAKPLNEDSVTAIAEERFSRATSGYVLIYTSAEKTDDWTEITESEVGRLTKGDTAWLSDCNFIIMAENLRDNEEKVAEEMVARLDAFENALKAEKVRQDNREG